MTTAPPSPWQTLADLLDPQPNPYLSDPVGWVGSRLGEFMWSAQRDVAESVRDNRYTAVPSAHDTGKSFNASRLACWWLDVHPPGEAFVVTTAPTAAQVEAILWREIGKAHRKGNLPGRTTLDAKWYIGSELVAYGRKPADYDQAAFQGIHAKYVLIIIDEADGVPKSLFEAVDSLATNANARVLAIGNPDNPTSYFAEVCKPGSGWSVRRIDGLTTPNFTEDRVAPYPQLAAYMESEGIPYSTEDVPDELRHLLIDPGWVDERIKRWGINSPIFSSKVRGLFPDVSDDTLIQPKYIVQAGAAHLQRTHKPRLGVDVARFGEDETVIHRREGPWFRTYEGHFKQSTVATTGHVIAAKRNIDREVDIQAWAEITVDSDGIGGSVVDQLVAQDFEVFAFRNGERAYDPERFVNRKSELYWAMREMFEAGEVDIDPTDDRLLAQLGAIKWALDSKGRIEIESKDKMRKRGLPSPDRADAMMMTLATVPEVSVVEAEDDESAETITGGLLDQNW